MFLIEETDNSKGRELHDKNGKQFSITKERVIVKIFNNQYVMYTIQLELRIILPVYSSWMSAQKQLLSIFGTKRAAGKTRSITDW